MKPGPIHAVISFVVVWFESRPYRKLLLGLPAVMLSIAVLLGMIARPFYTVEQKSHRYRVATLSAIEAEDIETARVCANKLWALDPNNHATLFFVANRLLSLDGGEQLGQEFIERLAPEHTPGYAPAHRWVAKRLLTSKMSPHPDEQKIVQLAERHLKLADEISKQDVESRYLWYLFHARVGNNAKALEHLQATARQAPQVAFDVMQIQLKLGNRAAAQSSAVAAQNYLRRVVDDPKQDSPQARFRLAKALLVLGDTTALLRELTSARDRFPRDQELLSESIAILDQHLGDLQSRHEPDVFRWNAIITLLHALEAREVVERRLLILARDKDPPDLLSKVASHWVQLLDSDEHASQFLDQMGANAASVGHWEAGRNWIQQAVVLNKKNHTALNNLAWVLLNADPSDPTKALELVNRALAIAPDDHRYRETRGQILVATQQWSKAILDLEFALNGLPNNAQVHESLAQCYIELGRPDLAHAHQDAAGL